MRQKLAYCAAAAAMFASDRLLKMLVSARKPETTLIPGVLRVTYVENRGAALGMFDAVPYFHVFVIALSFAVLAAVAWAVAKGALRNRAAEWSLTAVFAGAAGNLADRLLNGGFVVDFLAFDIVLNFFVFNLADVYITFGCAALCLCMLVTGRKEKNAVAPDNS
ncbi:MAG: signal peptidase II [Oscillospiraceae bacterium]|jgi:signal peptidase II|nr:signal peptidase II [Oscillospiraceae bacterium]